MIKENIFKQIKEAEVYTRPNSLISFLDNEIAFVIFSLIKEVSILSPNRITIISFILFLLSIPSLFLQHGYLSVFFIFMSYTFDNIDGIWARYYHQTSALGAWLDSTLDKIKEITILVALALMSNGLLNTSMMISINIYGIFLILRLFLKTYLDIEKEEEYDYGAKRFRVVAFGPAEYFLIVSAVILTPDSYRIYPALLLLLTIIICTLRELKLSIRNLSIIASRK